MSEHTFTDAHGVEIFYRRWAQDGAKAIVLIAHGASEHSARYDRFAQALNRAGYAAYGIDHRGHGRTGQLNTPGRMGPGGGTAVLDDLRQLADLAATEVPGVPVILFGHSMGSMFGQAFVEHHGEGLAGYVLSGCPGPMEGGDELKAGLQGAVDGGMADEPVDMLGPFNEAFEPARTKYDWLSRDPAEVDAYVNDPLCGDGNPLTYGYVNDLFGIAAPAFEPDGIAKVPSIPVLMITGEMDPAAGMAANARELEKRLRDAGLDVTARYYPDARHELLNETNRDEVTADVVAWLESVIGS